MTGRDPALLQKLFGVKRVEGPQVDDHGHELVEHALTVLGVLREQDGAHDLLQLGLHLLDEIGVAQSGAV